MPPSLRYSNTIGVLSGLPSTMDSMTASLRFVAFFIAPIGFDVLDAHRRTTFAASTSAAANHYFTFTRIK